MIASPEMLAAFEAWRVAELASHYACPCPDDVMDGLVNHAGDMLAALNAQPATNADDLVLKLFPLILWVFEPQRDNPPMCPELSAEEPCESAIASGYRAMMSDIVRISPTVAEAMLAPHRLAQGGAR